jgi:hypothetical protein
MVKVKYKRKVAPGYIMKALGKGDWTTSLSNLFTPGEAAAIMY